MPAVLIDLHTHTMPWSLDSGLRVEALLQRAKTAGLDGVCLTEHNATWAPAQAVRLSKEWGLAVFRGMEVSTELGHVLVFGLDHFRTEMMRLERLRDIVAESGSAMVLAHPHREPGLPVPLADLADWLHGVEVLNGSDANAANGYLAGLAAHAGLPGTGGSDAHSVGPIGTCATRFHAPLETDEALVQALREGRCEAVRLPTGHRKERPAPR